MDCSFISRQNTGRNRLINCICTILYVFTVDMHWIGIHALCQNFQKKLTSYCTALAPSIRAASYCSAGMFFKMPVTDITV